MPVVLPPFQRLLDAHGRDVHRFLSATVGREHADDCYQETWLSALRAYPQMRSEGNLRAWLLTIAHRKAIDHFRASARRGVGLDELPERPGPPPGDLRDETLWEQVRDLPPKQRAAIVLRFVADADYRDIAARMRTSEEAARRNVHEGIKRLRTEYER